LTFGSGVLQTFVSQLPPVSPVHLVQQQNSRQKNYVLSFILLLCSPTPHDGSTGRRFPRSADLFLDLRCRNKILFTQKGETQMANNTQTTTPKSQESKTDTASNRKPIHEIRMGRIKAAIWQNETDNIIRYNVTFGRLFKDGESWKQTESFGRDDLPVLAKVADQAHSFIFQKQQEPE